MYTTTNTNQIIGRSETSLYVQDEASSPHHKGGNIQLSYIIIITVIVITDGIVECERWDEFADSVIIKYMICRELYNILISSICRYIDTESSARVEKCALYDNNMTSYSSWSRNPIIVWPRCVLYYSLYRINFNRWYCSVTIILKLQNGIASVRRIISKRRVGHARVKHRRHHPTNLCTRRWWVLFIVY